MSPLRGFVFAYIIYYYKNATPPGFWLLFDYVSFKKISPLWGLSLYRISINPTPQSFDFSLIIFFLCEL